MVIKEIVKSRLFLKMNEYDENKYKVDNQRGRVFMRGQQFIALLYGWVVVLGLIIISSIILAFFLRFTSLNQSTLSWITLSVGLISLFIGGFIAGLKGRAKGWVIGIAVGIGFTLFTFLVQYLGYQQSFTMNQSLHHIGYILAALIGGIIGVNLVVPEKE